MVPSSKSSYIIGIAGPSCAGKTELARALVEAVRGPAVVLPIDAYYFGMEEIPLADRKKSNFDDPAAIEVGLLLDHLLQLSAGRPISRPIYCFETYSRIANTEHLEPADIIIVEGLFALYWEPLRSLLDLKVFVTAPGQLCFRQRLNRDVQRRGRSMESIRTQFCETVWPSAERYVLPTQKHADLCLFGDASLANSVKAVVQHLDNTFLQSQPPLAMKDTVSAA